MTLTDSFTGTTISSWRWLDDEGQPIGKDAATFRMWSVRRDAEPIHFFVAMPVSMSDYEVLAMACNISNAVKVAEAL